LHVDVIGLIIYAASEQFSCQVVNSYRAMYVRMTGVHRCVFKLRIMIAMLLLLAIEMIAAHCSDSLLSWHYQTYNIKH